MPLFEMINYPKLLLGDIYDCGISYPIFGSTITSQSFLHRVVRQGFEG
jgi:hypothetical protein